jgi:hypothetical protein
VPLRPHKTLKALAVLLLAGWSATAAAQQPASLGLEAQTDSEYAGELPGRRGVVLEFQSLATRDDNIFIDNTRRQGDYLVQQGVLLKLWDKTPRCSLILEYHPSGLLYRSASGLDALNQDLSFEGGVQVRPHLLLRWSDNFTRASGLAQLVANQDVAFLPAGPGPRLNVALHAPLAQELGNQSSLDLVYEFSRRSSVDLSGSYEFADFTAAGAAAPALVSQRSASAGLSYDYRLTRHVSVGARYLFQRYHFRAGTQDDTHSAYLTGSWEIGPHLLLSLFGGPQYSLTDGLFAIPGSPGSSFLAVSSQGWEPAGGASLTFRSDRTVVSLTGQRTVADGDGLLSSVTSWYGAAEVRRRITHAWDLVLTGSEARSLALQGPFGFGEVNTQSAGLALEHPLFGHLTLHAEYGYFRERTNQNVAFTANVDRNRYTLGVFYRTAVRRGQ